MTLPCYEFIKIESHQPEKLYEQLVPLKFGTLPIVLVIDHLAQNQLSILIEIEKYFEHHKYPTLPYSIYIIADCPDYNGPLFTAKSTKYLPQFFNKKPKALNSKESSFYNKIQLKQENFKNLNSKEYTEILRNFSTGHRSISQKQNFLVYLEKINKGLKDYYGKKE